MRSAILPFAVLLTACAAYHPTSLAELEAPHPVRATYQVWVAGHEQTLHAVRVAKDSLYGIPFFKPPECDSCTVAIARAAIDSVRSLDAPVTVARTGAATLGGAFVIVLLPILLYVAGHALSI